MQDSIFTKIIKGEIPCHKVYEDDTTLAFLDIHPLVPGHTLVVPKVQVDHIYDLSDQDYTAVFATVKKVAVHLKETMGTNRSVILVVGYDVPHAHVHILPCDHAQDFYDQITRAKEIASSEPDHTQLAEMAERLQF